MTKLESMLSEGSKISSKRTITFLMSVALLVSYFSEQWMNMDIGDAKFQYLVYLIEVGLGTVAVEKGIKMWAERTQNKPKQDETP